MVAGQVPFASELFVAVFVGAYESIGWLYTEADFF
jgi:hypothetical protein